MPLPWGHGEMFSMRMASTFMRVSSRGLQTSMFPASNVSNGLHMWKQFNCDTAMSALCVDESGGHFDIFPTHDQVFISQEFSTSYIHSNSYLTVFDSDNACNRSNTGRLLQASKDTYSITLCDIIDSNLDILIKFGRTDFGDMTVYWRQDETSVWLLVFLAIVSIYLVSCVAQNIVSVIQNDIRLGLDHASRRQFWQYITTSLVFVVLFYDFSKNSMFTCLVLVSDKRLLVHLFSYVLLEWIWQVSVHAKKTKKPPHHEHFASTVSILTATLLLISARIHMTFDNPYVAILTALFGVRTCYKLLWLHLHAMHTLQHLMQIVDLFVFCSLLGNAILPISPSVLDGTILQLVIVFISFSVAGLLVLYKITYAGCNS